MDLFQKTLAANWGDPVLAGVDLSHKLMAGDPSSFKAGYSAENAAFAVQDAFDLTDGQRQEVLERVNGTYVPGHGEIEFATGLYDGVRYGVPAEWYVYRWETSDMPEGCWNPIMGPFESEARAREEYGYRLEFGMI